VPGCLAVLATGCLCAQNIPISTNLSAREEQIIAAARGDAMPRFNGARIMGIRSTPNVRDLWPRNDLGRQKNLVAELPAHGCKLLQVR